MLRGQQRVLVGDDVAQIIIKPIQEQNAVLELQTQLGSVEAQEF